jgi:hypothetical protein
VRQRLGPVPREHRPLPRRAHRGDRPLSQQAVNPETVSSICAVLAETDVINMVSRGIATADILKGIHLSMAGRSSSCSRSPASRAARRC